MSGFVYSKPRRERPKAWKRHWCRLVGHQWGLCRHMSKIRERCARCGEWKP